MDSARGAAETIADAIWDDGLSHMPIYEPAASVILRQIEVIVEPIIAARDAALWRMAQEQMREKAADHVPWSDGKCSCGIKYSAGSSMTPLEDWQNHIRSLPLDPLPNGDNHE